MSIHSGKENNDVNVSIYSNKLWLINLKKQQPPDSLPNWLHHFTCPPAAHEGPISSTCTPTRMTSCPFDDGCSNRREAVFPCGFDLHFPDD